ELLADVGCQDHVGEPGLRIAGAEQAGELAPRLGERGRGSAAGAFGFARLVVHRAQLLRELAMAATRRVLGELQDGREEPIIVTFDVALEERLDLFGGGHIEPVYRSCCPRRSARSGETSRRLRLAAAVRCTGAGSAGRDRAVAARFAATMTWTDPRPGRRVSAGRGRGESTAA